MKAETLFCRGMTFAIASLAVGEDKYDLLQS
jgi:hypothetical protein